MATAAMEIVPFTATGSPGSPQTVNLVTHTGDTPKGIVFVLADSSGTNGESFSLGYDDGTSHVSTAAGIADSFGIQTARSISSVYSLITEQAQAFFGGYQRRLAGYVSAVGVGSFTITYDLNNTPGAQWYAIVLLGDNLSCKVGTYDVSTGPGTVDVGFPVAALLHLNACLNVSGVPITSEVAGTTLRYGLASVCPNPDNQVGMIFTGPAGGGGTTASYHAADICQAHITSGLAGPSDETTISSWGSTSFAIDCPSGSSNAADFGYMAIGGDGVSANLVPIVQPSSTGVQNTALTAVSPFGVFFVSACKVFSSSPTPDIQAMFGAYDGVTNLSEWWGNVSNTTKRDRVTSTTKAVTMATATGVSTSTVNATASASLSTNQLSLNWTTVDSTARELWALVLAENLVPGQANPCGDLLPVSGEIQCSITISAPAIIPSVGVQQWRLQRFDAKIRREQAS